MNEKLCNGIKDYQKSRFGRKYEIRIFKSEKSSYYHEDFPGESFATKKTNFSGSPFIGNENHVPYRDRYILDIAFWNEIKKCFYHLCKSGFQPRKEMENRIVNDSIVLTELEILSLYENLKSLKAVKEYERIRHVWAMKGVLKKELNKLFNIKPPFSIKL